MTRRQLLNLWLTMLMAWLVGRLESLNEIDETIDLGVEEDQHEMLEVDLQLPSVVVEKYRESDNQYDIHNEPWIKCNGGVEIRKRYVQFSFKFDV